MAANHLKGEIDLPVDKQTYTLALTSNAIVQVEQLLDSSITEIMKGLTRYENSRALLWAGLQKYHPKIDLLAAGEIIDEIDGGLEGLVDPLARAVRFRLSRTPIDNPLELERE